MPSRSWSAGLRGTVLRPLTTGHRVAGDRARDAQRWDEAAAHYAAHLRRRPEDFSAWVQRGNCLKEAGHYEDALAAYRDAIAINERNADVHLQKGHLLKVMGWQSGAIQSYQRSLDLRPKNNHALEELLRLGAHDAVRAAFAAGTEAAAASTPTIYLDFSDLVIYLHHNESLSGIQRVVANLLVHADAFVRAGNREACRIVPVLPDYHQFTIGAVSLDLVISLLATAETRKDREDIDVALEAVQSSRRRVEPRRGDSFIIAGAFWIYGRYDLLNRLRVAGVNVAIYIHDLIQITNHEYVARDANNDFRRSIVDVLCVSSYVMTNSAFVAGEVRRYLDERLNFTIPVEPVTLATELGGPSEATSEPGGEIAFLATTEYVLVVSTIEVRKNHDYVIAIWEKLLRDYAGEVPDLVFVGKWGWQIERLRREIEESDYLGGRLHIFNGISDADLAALYRHCLFTVYPSFAEGWGLPVGESLGYGKPCIASRVTAIPEVGGRFCRYIDPYDVEDGYRAVVRALSDRDDLEAWRADIRANFQPKTWRDFTTQFYETVLRFKAANGDAPLRNNVVLEPEAIAAFGHAGITQLGFDERRLVTARMTRMAGWHNLEAWGCWAAKRRADLLVALRSEPGTPIVVALCLCAPGEEAPADCTVEIGAHRGHLEGLGPLPRWFAIEAVVGEDRSIRVVFTAGRGFGRALDGTERYVGILAIGFAAADDPAARMRLMEAIVPGGLAPVP